MLRVWTGLVGVLVVGGLAPGWTDIGAQSAAFAIKDVRVFDGHAFSEDRTVLVEDGIVVQVGAADLSVPAGVEIIPGEGRTLLPGLIDSHVHISQLVPERALRQALTFGVTVQIDMFTSAAALSRWNALKPDDAPDLSAVRSAGFGATAPGGHPTQMNVGPGAVPIPTLTRPEEAEAWVKDRVREGSDFIKVVHDGRAYGFGSPLPTLSKETVSAIVTAAHRSEKMVIAHIGTEADARAAIDAGVDGLAHLFMGASARSDFGRFAANHGVFVIPTLSVLHYLCGRSDGPDLLADARALPRIDPLFRGTLSVPSPSGNLSCDGAEEAVRQLVAAEVPLLVGTDAPAPGMAYGASVHRELSHLVRAGMSTADALAAATAVPARIFRLGGRGEIQAGRQADLLLVEGDASVNIEATRNIVGVWKRGRRIPQ